MVVEIDLKEWHRIHPRASKWHPHWYVDFCEDGALAEDVEEIYSWTACTNLVCERDGWKCRVCGGNGIRKTEYGRRIEVHHIIPKSKGGADHPLNLITLCNECHPKTFLNEYGGIPGVTFKEIIRQSGRFKTHKDNTKLEMFDGGDNIVSL